MMQFLWSNLAEQMSSDTLTRGFAMARLDTGESDDSELEKRIQVCVCGMIIYTCMHTFPIAPALALWRTS